MTIWFDFGHIPQYNFGSAMVRLLAEQGHTVYVTVLKRGRLFDIAKKELACYPNVHVCAIGKHGMNKVSAIWDANFKRIISMLKWARGKHIDCAISSTLPCAFVARIMGARMYAYTDDTQRSTYPWIVRFCTSETNLIVPPEGKLAQKKTTVLNALKEWAYLAPNVFQPNVHALDKYGVRPKEYIFLREVSVGTVNYAGQAQGAIRDVAGKIEEARGGEDRRREDRRIENRNIEDRRVEDRGIENRNIEDRRREEGTSGGRMKVLFSLEEKHRRDEYPADWILLQEPIEDIHSLIYYSAGLVSSGDSMAREAALLGIPSYYLGTRHSMPANLAAAKVANLQNELTMPFAQWLEQLRGTDSERIEDRRERMTEEQAALRQKIDSEFIDINQYMLSLVSAVE